MKFLETAISEDFLNKNPNAIFVFGDNLMRTGTGGAAKLRRHPQTLGFITKKRPNNEDSSFFHPDEYRPYFEKGLDQLKQRIKQFPENTFYISKLGSGLANRYKIWEKVICDKLVQELLPFDNVIFCFPKP